MPVKWILYWQPNAGATVSSQILNEISQAVETIHGVKDGRWKATLNSYKPIFRGDQAVPSVYARDFLGISLPEQPNKYYFIIRGQKIVLEADSTIQTIMDNLQSYKSRISVNFEGVQYLLGDFKLRVGKVASIHSESLRGIILEVEYLPLFSLDKARPVLEDFIDIWHEALSKRSLPGRFSHNEPMFSEFGLSDFYTSQHTAVQYASIMAQLFASAQAGQSIRN